MGSPHGWGWAHLFGRDGLWNQRAHDNTSTGQMGSFECVFSLGRSFYLSYAPTSGRRRCHQKDDPVCLPRQWPANWKGLKTPPSSAEAFAPWRRKTGGPVAAGSLTTRCALLGSDGPLVRWLGVQRKDHWDLKELFSSRGRGTSHEESCIFV